MLHTFLKSLTPQHQGLIALFIGSTLLFGALGKLGFFQAFLNIFMIVAGIYLLLWGLHKSNLMTSIRNKFSKK